MVEYDILKAIKEAHDADTRKFFVENEVFIIRFCGNPLNRIGISRFCALNKKFSEVVLKLSQSLNSLIKSVDYFKSALPFPYSEFVGLQEDFFWYLVFDLKDGAVVGGEQKELLRTHVRKQLNALFYYYEIPHLIYCQSNDQEYIEFHYNAQQFYRAAKKDGANSAKSAAFRRKKKPIRASDAPPAGFINVFGEMSVADFIHGMRANAQFLANNLFEITAFARHDRRDYKYMREECLPLLAYLKHFNIEMDATITVPKERGEWDGRIRRRDKEDLIIEVTQALPSEAHWFREAMTAGFRWKLSLEERTRHQKGIDEFPTPIIDAIARKHCKNYKDSRILLVSIMGEYTDEDDAIIDEWLKDVRRRTEIGAFSFIYLVELARYKLFKIFPPDSA